jgi:hypothetical protein
MTIGNLQKTQLTPNESLDVTAGLYQIVPFQKGATLSLETYDSGSEQYSSVPVSAGTFFLDTTAVLVNRSSGSIRIGYAKISEEVAE